MAKGRRYNKREKEQKLNLKKVFGVILVIAIIILAIVFGKNFIPKSRETQKIISQSYFASYENNKWGVIDAKGNNVIDPSYQEMIVVPNSKKDVFLCTYNVDYKTGEYKTKVLNSKNEEIFKEYDKVEAIANHNESNTLWYEENVLKVKQGEKYGLINLEGKQVANIEYDEIEAIVGIENALKVKKDGKCGIINNEGTKIIALDFADITNLGKDNKAGYIIKGDNEKFGVVDYSDKQILEMKYDKIEKTHGSNLYAVTEDGIKKVIDKTGKNIVTQGFDNIISISEMSGDDSGIIFEKSGKYGFMTLNGEIKIEAKYDKLQETNKGILIAAQGEKYGLIDIAENEKVPFESNKIKYNKKADIYILEDENYNEKVLDNNLEEKLSGIVVQINEEKDYIEMREKEEYKYYNFKFEEKKVSDILTENEIFLNKNNGKYGFVDKKGNVVVDYKYDDATNCNQYGFAGVKENGKWGAINSKGEIVISPTYQLDNYLEIDFIGKWHKGLDVNMNYYCKE